MKKSPKKWALGFQGWFLAQPHTGIGKHSIGLLRAILKTGTPKVTVLVPQAVQIKGVPASCIHVLKPKKGLPASLQKAYWERVQVPAFFASRELDWEYYPYPCPLPPESKHRRAMTVHDLILWDDPRYKGGRLKSKYHRDARRTLVYMDELFAVSDSTKKELGIPSVKRLYNAVEVEEASKRSHNLSKTTPKKLIYLGGYDLRKQVPLLIEHFIRFHKKHPDYTLHLLGAPHHASKWYPSCPEHPAVLRKGKLSDKELQEELSSARALVHASDSEGFNLPLLEAMSMGIPAVVRDIPVNREISGGTALFWNPSKKGELSRILESLEDSKQWRKVSTAQKKMARKYHWELTAKEFIKILTR